MTSLYHVDAFAQRPFTGNPAAVCLLDAPRDDAWLQALAAEVNLPETAFLLPSGPDYSLRWFSPKIEVDLCGHATLASAHVLWESGALAPDSEARFHTKSGLLTAQRRDGRIELNFPITPAAECDPEPVLEQALGVPALHIARSAFDYLVEVASEQAVRDLTPDLHLLRTLPVRGIMVTAPAESREYDFVSRFFAPATGIDEDPVTGSAHCCLGPYWAARFGKTSLTGYQASARGGIVHVRLEGDRAFLSGAAVTITRGELVTDEEGAEQIRKG